MLYPKSDVLKDPTSCEDLSDTENQPCVPPSDLRQQVQRVYHRSLQGTRGPFSSHTSQEVLDTWLELYKGPVLSLHPVAGAVRLHENEARQKSPEHTQWLHTDVATELLTKSSS